MTINVELKPSLQQIGGKFSKLELNQELHNILNEFAFSIESYAKQVTPVVTGQLRGSIGVASLISAGIEIGGKFIIAPHTNYAGFVHEGTRYMKARPFMLWGVQFAEKRFNDKEFARRLDDKLRKELSTL